MIEKVISGFQSGADIAGIKAARACQIPTSGWMPARFLTEDGPKPEYRELYNAIEHPAPDYPPGPPRTSPWPPPSSCSATRNPGARG